MMFHCFFPGTQLEEKFNIYTRLLKKNVIAEMTRSIVYAR